MIKPKPAKRRGQGRYMQDEEKTKLISREQAASLLGVSLSTIDRLIKNGALPVVRVSAKVVRINRDEIERIKGGVA